MGTSAMGKVAVAAKIENYSDLDQAERGELQLDQVRAVEVTDALVDTGATMLSLPLALIEKLGLKRRRTRKIRSATGLADMGVYDAVRLTIQARDCIVEVGDLAPGCPVLIGQIPLEALDWVVDPIGQRLIGNPDHNGEWMYDLF
jgi:predicted aspartyl protease